jgi:hypothetical protein
VRSFLGPQNGLCAQPPANLGLALQNDIQQCAMNPTCVEPFNFSISDPPTPMELLAIANKVDDGIGSIKQA